MYGANRTGPPILAGFSPLIFGDIRILAVSLLAPFQHAQRHCRMRWRYVSTCSTFINTPLYVIATQNSGHFVQFYSLATSTSLADQLLNTVPVVTISFFFFFPLISDVVMELNPRYVQFFNVATCSSPSAEYRLYSRIYLSGEKALTVNITSISVRFMFSSNWPAASSHCRKISYDPVTYSGTTLNQRCAHSLQIIIQRHWLELEHLALIDALK